MTDVENIELLNMKICFVSTPLQLFERGFWQGVGFITAFSLLVFSYWIVFFIYEALK